MKDKGGMQVKKGGTAGPGPTPFPLGAETQVPEAFTKDT